MYTALTQRPGHFCAAQMHKQEVKRVRRKSFGFLMAIDAVSSLLSLEMSAVGKKGETISFAMTNHIFGECCSFTANFA